MPYVEIKVFEERFEDPEFPGRMIAAITDAVSLVLGPEVGADSTVIVEGVPRSRWGHAGHTMVRSESEPGSGEASQAGLGGDGL